MRRGITQMAPEGGKRGPAGAKARQVTAKLALSAGLVARQTRENPTVFSFKVKAAQEERIQ
ncbi:hypothetical protein ACHFCA_33100 [Delftia tsuruhatensis]